VPTSKGIRWWIPATGLVVCATLVTAGFGWSVSQATRTNAVNALADAGIRGVTVENSYRDVTLTGPAGLANKSLGIVHADPRVKSLQYLVVDTPQPQPDASPTPQLTTSVSPEPSSSPPPCATSCSNPAVLPDPQTLYFETNSATLDSSSVSSLDALSSIMLAALEVDPNLRLSIAAHADSIGTEAGNQTLSESRAAAVHNYLVGKGIPSDVLVAVGYGESRPIASNDTESGRAANRRVDIAIIGED
jgi:outer membrane protein OmpA-like peptidoglycan-associated protein